MTDAVGGHLAALFARDAFTVTGEIVPPAGGSLEPVRRARGRCSSDRSTRST